MVSYDEGHNLVMYILHTNALSSKEWDRMVNLHLDSISKIRRGVMRR